MIKNRTGLIPLAIVNEATTLSFKNGKFFLNEIFDSRSKKFIANIPDYKFSVLSRFRIFQRILRNVPGPIVRVDDNTCIYQYRSKIYKLDIKNKKICLELELEKPKKVLYFTKVACQKTGEVCIYFGEYFENKSQECVRVWKRNGYGVWSIFSVFPEKTIEHVHNVIYDKFADRFIILTGDFGNSSGIWSISDQNRIPEKILTGSQLYRAAWAYVNDSCLIYATDTPFEQNYLVELNLSDRSKSPKKLYPISGSSIYGTTTPDRNNFLYFSTAVEPVELVGNRFLDVFQVRRGNGIIENKSYLYKYALETNDLKVIDNAKKDCVPMRLGQYGTYYLSDALVNHDFVLGYGIALAGFDATTFCIR